MIFDNNVKSVWNQNERKQLILTDDHNTFSTTNWVDLTLNRWGQKRTHAKIHPDKSLPLQCFSRAQPGRRPNVDKGTLFRRCWVI